MNGGFTVVKVLNRAARIASDLEHPVAAYLEILTPHRHLDLATGDRADTDFVGNGFPSMRRTAWDEQDVESEVSVNRHLF